MVKIVEFDFVCKKLVSVRRLYSICRVIKLHSLAIFLSEMPRP